MKGYRFYEEFDSSYMKRKHCGTGNILALDIPVQHYVIGGYMECTAAILSTPDSPVAGTQVNYRVLAKNYRRISESKARIIHPTMFAFLDQFDAEGNYKYTADASAE